MDRRDFVGTMSALGVGMTLRPERVSAETAADAPPAAAFAFEEATVGDLQARMTKGTLTSRALTQAYLTRIAAIDKAGPTLRSVIEVNPDALAIAAERDAERRAGKVRGPLHGIPVLVKDNLDSADKMQTTAGSLALVGAPAPRDSFVVEQLRAAGAVLIGKTNLSEWANFRSTHSSSGWSARGGQVKHAYVLDRNPCGSSSGSGTAIAANLATLGIGTETDGSIICPSSIGGIVGLKPTVGLVSRAGIIPISASQDTAGPMCRTVRDTALVLQAIAGRDPRDSATQAAPAGVPDYVSGLTADALKGARIGVARNLAGFHTKVDAVFEQALEALKRAGAVLIDPVTVPNVGKYDEAENIVLQYEFKDGLNAYLAGRGGTVKHKTLSALIAYNRNDAAREMPWFGQEIFEQSEARGPLTDKAYVDALATCRRLSRAEGLDALFAQQQLDAIVAPSNGPSWTTDLVNGDHFGGGNTSVAAVAGYPSLTVPMGYTSELPLGLSFTGLAWTEAKLLAYGYAFEQATKVRKAPRFLRTIG